MVERGRRWAAGLGKTHPRVLRLFAAVDDFLRADRLALAHPSAEATAACAAAARALQAYLAEHTTVGPDPSMGDVCAYFRGVEAFCVGGISAPTPRDGLRKLDGPPGT